MHIRGARGPLSKRELRAVYHQIWYHAGVIRKALVRFALGAIREKGTSLDHIPYSWVRVVIDKGNHVSQWISHWGLQSGLYKIITKMKFIFCDIDKYGWIMLFFFHFYC